MAGDWSMLPLDIVIDIAMKLETLEDFNYFSAVCRWWSCAPPLIKNHWKPVMPWLLLAENTKDNPDCVREIFTLSNTKCLKPKLPETFGARCWGSPYGWVAMVDYDFNILLFNPITKARLSFPHWETLPNPPEVSLGGQKCSIYAEEFHSWFLNFFMTKLFVLKVHRNGHHEFVIAILYRSRMELALARHEDQSWTPVSVPKGTTVRVSDIISIDDKIYALYDDAAIRYWTLKEIGYERLVNPVAYIPGTGRSFEVFKREVRTGIRKMYLVQTGSDLLIVFRYKEIVRININIHNDDHPIYEYDPNTLYRTFKFCVVRAVHREDKTWEHVDDLGDVALFLGNNNSMSMSTTHFKYLRRNCIYFTDDQNELWEGPTEFGGHDMGVYDLKSAQILPFYEGDSIRSSFCPATFFITQKS